MWTYVRSKSNANIQIIWNNLVDYNADDYYDETNGIIMDERGMSHV